MPEALPPGDSRQLDQAAPATVPEDARSPRGGSLKNVFAFLRRHPILCLLLLTPGIPEYLSSSSPLYAIVLNPAQFVFQLTANLGLYGPGVLLIREAMIRWNKGWATALLLGAAYGILEEGVALSTLFDPKASPVGQLGYFGHWAGVSWIWSATIIPVHMLFSISIPILLLGLAMPSTRGKSLLSTRGIKAVLVILVADVASLMLLITLGEHFWMGDTVFVASLAAIAFIVWLARRVPSGVPLARTSSPRVSPRRMAVLGIVFYPSTLLVSGIGMSEGAPALLVLLLVILVQGLFLVYVLRVAGASENEPQLIALCFGLIVPIAAIGLIATIAVPAALVGDVVLVLFFRMLWRRYRVGPEVPAPTGKGEQGKGLSQI
ncbi:MAG: hypothetical protein ABSA72_05955 [Nitrososphaerales archaeon]|jgi:hypothetical protein